jgi:GTPase SAR1 family protein
MSAVAPYASLSQHECITVQHATAVFQVELNWVSVTKSESFKTVFLGDSNVGKTCLAKLYVEGKVVEHSTNTIGFDHHVKEIEPEEGRPLKVR